MDRPRPPKGPIRSYKNILFWVAAGIIIIILWSVLQTPGAASREVNFSDFMNQVENDQVAEVTITGNQIKGKYTDETAFETVSPTQFDDLVKILREHNVSINVKDTSRSPWFSYLFTWFPIVILILFWIFFMRQMQSGATKPSLSERAGPNSSPGYKKK